MKPYNNVSSRRSENPGSFIVKLQRYKNHGVFALYQHGGALAGLIKRCTKLLGSGNTLAVDSDDNVARLDARFCGNSCDGLDNQISIGMQCQLFIARKLTYGETEMAGLD